MIVVDASVAAKWLLPEASSDAALVLQEGPEQLFAPELIRLEVSAAITRRVRDAKLPLPPDEAIRRCEKWLRLLEQATVTLLPENELLDHATRLSVKIKHPLRDCMYLAAARALEAPLITADETFQQRAAPFYPRITLLLGHMTN